MRMAQSEMALLVLVVALPMVAVMAAVLAVVKVLVLCLARGLLYQVNNRASSDLLQ